jgi:NAD(P)-dependent dehydrogenase (short-subunit alcohol dehydrogenase family)
MAVKADVSNPDDAQRLIQGAVKGFGRIDILFNNAGIAVDDDTVAEIDIADWNRTISTNLTGVFLVSRFAIKTMIENKGGVIINTGSTAGLLGTPGLAAYSASKAAVIQLTKQMAVEYASRNIRVNCICPFLVRTPMLSEETAMKAMKLAAIQRVASPEEIAQSVLFLASKEASYITAAVLTVDGGYANIRGIV